MQAIEIVSRRAPPAPPRRRLGWLALGAMLASLVVVVYACLHTGSSILQAQIVRQGMAWVLLVWCGGLVTSLARSGGRARAQRGFAVKLAP